MATLGPRLCANRRGHLAPLSEDLLCPPQPARVAYVLSGFAGLGCGWACSGVHLHRDHPSSFERGQEPAPESDPPN